MPENSIPDGENKKMKKILTLCLFAAIFSLAAFADVRVPDTPKPTPAPKQKKALDGNLEIRLDRNATEAKLIIPRSQLRQLRAELEELDTDSGNTASAAFTRTQTIVSGLFLSLAFVFGGVWFMRSRSGKAGKTIAAAALLFMLGAAGSVALANVGPPPENRKITGKLFNREIFSNWRSAYGKIKIEVSDQESIIELVVPDQEDAKK